MKKTLKTLIAFMIAFSILAIGKAVQANSINKISMDIYIDKNGNANITEVWDCKATSGTEVYHPYYNLGNSEIKNLSVKDATTEYTTLSKWKTSGDLKSKANKCGLNYISNGVEICWGISDYGTHKYTVKYDITNFVAQLQDSQMVYWTLIPYDFSNAIGEVYIKIHTFYDMPDNTDVWGFGDYGAPVYVYDGYIEMQSNGKLDTSEYMVILAKFPDETFDITNNTYDYNFDHYLQMAKSGAIEYKSEDKNSNFIEDIIAAIFFIGIMGINIFIFIFAGVSASYNSHDIDYGEAGKKIPKDVDYYRDIPCKKDVQRAYYIAYQYNLIKKETDVLGAIILKWVKDGLIKLEQKEEGKVFKKENTVIILTGTSKYAFENEFERELFGMLCQASGDGILESKEFEKWCGKHYSKILDWFKDVRSKQKDLLINEGLIIKEEIKRLKIFKTTKYTATPELKQEALEIAGLKKYLTDYTLINDREAIEVNLFEEYLIYAQMLGIAKKVAEQFKKIYPDVVEQSNFSSYDYIIFINMSTNRGISRANSAKARAESYSSGGGGFSSGGGGGGSFGGGGGGGGFR
ncbi:MAG: DUF2207 domain-containing protein [Clostridia bacterium]|nr:DUF2207 domain-containing protein [Clostridia bacterium]